ncbi:MAG: hypothetical protein IJ491_04605 [Clostridia bacterium]|nr:hypothetical protein [Clostridia bacterium]
MATVKPEAFFKNERRQKRLLVVTVIMFLCLAAETVVSGLMAVYEQGGTHLDFHLKPLKILSIIIYLTVAFLLYKRVNYKLLLIPDFFLFGIKVYTIVSSLYYLFGADTVGAYTTLSEWEYITESGLFCLFLLTLFASKLLPVSESMHLKLPYICLGSLALCFPFTVIFEAIKAIDETVLHALPLSASFFNFFIGVMSEAFLDLPYALLLFVVFFVPPKGKKAKSEGSG